MRRTGSSCAFRLPQGPLGTCALVFFASLGCLAPFYCVAESQNAVPLKGVPDGDPDIQTECEWVKKASKCAVLGSEAKKVGSILEGSGAKREGRTLEEFRSQLGEGACWSRSESQCWRDPANSVHPSPTLLRYIESYKMYARACHEKEDSEELQRKLSAGQSTECRYLLWTPTWDGLGNRILHLVSSFVYALLTHRVLLLDPNEAFPELFCDPFPTPWVFHHDRKIFRIPPCWVSSKPWSCNTTGPPPPLVTWNFHSKVRPEDGRFTFCEDYHDWTDAASTVTTCGNQYFVPMLFLNRNFSKLLWELFPRGRIFATVANFLLHPNNAVWARAAEFLAAHENEARLRLGLQYRDLHFRTVPQGVENAKTCIIGIRGSALANEITARHEQLRGFGASDAPAAAGNQDRLQDVSILVASLTPEFISTLRRNYSGSDAGDSTEHCRWNGRDGRSKDQRDGRVEDKRAVSNKNSNASRAQLSHPNDIDDSGIRMAPVAAETAREDDHQAEGKNLVAATTVAAREAHEGAGPEESRREDGNASVAVERGDGAARKLLGSGERQERQADFPLLPSIPKRLLRLQEEQERSREGNKGPLSSIPNEDERPRNASSARVCIHTLSSDTMQDSHNPVHNEGALLDIVVLSLFPDFLILCERSTFGYVAQAWSGAPAVFLQDCTTMPPDPCFHVPPPSLQCCKSSYSIAKTSHAQPYLKPCHDWHGGVYIEQG